MKIRRFGWVGIAGSGDGNSTPDRLLVGHALAQLCAEHRAVICRSHYQGWTIAQIATDLGITEAMAMARLHYAVRALRQMLQRPMVAEPQATGGRSSNVKPSPTPRSPGSMLFDDSSP